MKYDLIVVACSSTPQLIETTQRCIDSCLAEGAKVNVIVVETCNPTKYIGADKILEYKGNFCYNRCLNLGLTEAKGDVHILANNDIIFHKGWSVIGESMKLNNFLSACALSNDHRQRTFLRGDWIYEGYMIGIHLPGWCIFVAKECIEIIGQINEDVDFWYSDNVYAEQLMKYGIRHGLFCNVRVDHFPSQTLRSKNPSYQRKMLHESQFKYFNRNAKGKTA